MSAIKVGLRFRPVLKKENLNNQQWIVNGSTIRSKNRKYHFSFANVFDEDASNYEVYEKLGRPIIDKFLDGYNGTIFTFGQTSSGKTHTMVGNQYTKGLIEMAIDDITQKIPNYSNVHVGYIEVYNEKIFDLLDEKKCELKMFERKGETMTTQKQFEVKSKEEILNYFYEGNRCKKMGESITNENSSRSHTIFKITLESMGDNGQMKLSNLFLVDLAGSEKPDMTKNSFNEGLFINKSLLALGKIIRQLSEKNVNVKKLRYRDSILTRLLSPALGGNSFTSIICTLSSTSLDETFYTICFAENAERAKCKPTLNAIASNSKEVKFLKDELERLQNELDMTKASIINETCLNCSSTIHESFHEKNILNIESTRKRNRPKEEEEEIAMPAQKIFVKSVELSKNFRDEIEKLKEELRNYEIENEKLKFELKEVVEKVKSEEKKNLKLNQKNIFLKGSLHEKNTQIKKLKEKMEQNNEAIHENCELAALHKNLIIHALENELKKSKDKNQKMTKKYDDKIELICQDFNSKINIKDEKISLLNQAIENQNYIEQDLNFNLKNSLELLKAQLQESENLIKDMNEENIKLKSINDSLKAGFKASHKNTRDQLNDIVKLKQEQAAEFNEKLREFKTQELKNHLKLQEFHHSKYNDIRSKNEELNSKIIQLQLAISEKDEEITKLKNRYENIEKTKEDIKKHGMEKIKFIKQHFQMKLLDKTNQFQKILKSKDCEIKSIFNNHSTTDSVIGEIFNSTMKHELIAR